MTSSLIDSRKGTLNLHSVSFKNIVLQNVPLLSISTSIGKFSLGYSERKETIDDQEYNILNSFESITR